MGHDGVVSIETHYGVDSAEIEFQWGVKFSVPVRTHPRAQRASYAVVIPGGKAAGVWC
jgi:hypothetical protein